MLFANLEDNLLDSGLALGGFLWGRGWEDCIIGRSPRSSVCFRLEYLGP